MKYKLEALLCSVGVFMHYRGYPYLIQAVLLAAEDPKRLSHICKEIYIPIAQKNHTTLSNVNKDIRTLRDSFWNHGGKEQVIQWTGCRTWEYQKPYPKEFIGILVFVLEAMDKDEFS